MINVIIHTCKKPLEKVMPEQWNELSAFQLQMVARSFFLEKDPQTLKVKLVVILLDLSFKELRAITPELMYDQLFPLIEWILEECAITEQKLPVISRRLGRKYYGPASELDNVRWSEFDSAEQALYDWHADMSNMSLLYRFVAILYRPAGGSSPDDVRMPFDPAIVAQEAVRISKVIKPHQAFAILLWYKGCKSKIVSLYPKLFNGSEGGGEPERPGYFPLMRMVAKEGIYGDLDKVEQLYIYTVFSELEACMEEREAAEEALKNNNQ